MSVRPTSGDEPTIACLSMCAVRWVRANLGEYMQLRGCMQHAHMCVHVHVYELKTKRCCARRAAPTSTRGLVILPMVHGGLNIVYATCMPLWPLIYEPDCDSQPATRTAPQCTTYHLL